MKPTTAACLMAAFSLQSAIAEPPRAPETAELTAATANRDARLAWWREARFGMFVHWGVYSHLGGAWKGKSYGGYAEHIQRAQKIPMDVYRKEVVEKFNPTGFNADQWVSLAKQAGMGYFIITAKHHDGFAMFDSKVSDYNIVKATPFHRDPMKELQAACKRQGVKFGFYYSHAFDWGEENAPGNDWDWKNPGGDKLLHGADWWLKYPEFLPKARRYVDEKAIPQILELIHQYPPDILWFDTPHKLPPEENLRILAAVRKADPHIVVNGRIFSSAWPELGSLTDYRNTVDKPSEFPPTPGDWEGIPTTNESYGYNQGDKSHKPPGHFIQLLAKAAARGGNTLMNIGPMGNGEVAPEDVAILDAIGAWWKVHGESIRGTTRTPLPVQPWGESTRKGNTLYLHVFEWPRDGKLTVAGLKTEVKDIRLLGKADVKLVTSKPNPLDLEIKGLPTNASDASDSVIAITCKGAPEADDHRLLSTSNQSDTLRGFDAKLEGNLSFGPGKTTDAWVKNWKQKKDAIVWPVRVNQSSTFDFTLVYDAPHDTARNRIVDGDAGKELLKANKGSGGSYTVAIGPKTFTATVKPGLRVNEPLGRVTLPMGNHEFRISANEITGEELFRVRQITIKPVQP
jgi:alpha-L-fucosidase